MPYDIDGREYDGRHFQLANNAQFYGPPKTNYQIFVEKLTEEFPYEGILDDIKVYLEVWMRQTTGHTETVEQTKKSSTIIIRLASISRSFNFKMQHEST